LRPGETSLVEIRHEGLGVGGSVIVVGSDPADRPVIVKLVRYGAIAGRVLDEDGLPLAGAKVSAIAANRQGYGPSDPNFRPRESVSDGDGRFRIDGINPSLSVRLWFHKPGAPAYSHTPKPDKDMSNLTATAGKTLDVGNITVHFNVVR
jgi:protocatechuate 3,4-dioxygenase beta subunit